jgi:hypothetical protein
MESAFLFTFWLVQQDTDPLISVDKLQLVFTIPLDYTNMDWVGPTQSTRQAPSHQLSPPNLHPLLPN